jgi:hypothetical protein
MVLFILFYNMPVLIFHMNIYLQIMCELCTNLFTVTAYKMHYSHRHERVESLDPRTFSFKSGGVVGFSVFV